MRNLFIALVAAAAAALPVAAVAGDYPCTNQCPLAEQANTHRSSGEESLRESGVVRHDVAAEVAKNLDRI